mmetsp:Transcript_76220/g.210330  ORF Transcript_76220/g.210330 Transcript_76220/m.210330 type:complete len:201 (+) Transcript_76220:369-971(+)
MLSGPSTHMETACMPPARRRGRGLASARPRQKWPRRSTPCTAALAPRQRSRPLPRSGRCTRAGWHGCHTGGPTRPPCRRGGTADPRWCRRGRPARATCARTSTPRPGSTPARPRRRAALCRSPPCCSRAHWRRALHNMAACLHLAQRELPNLPGPHSANLRSVSHGPCSPRPRFAPTLEWRLAAATGRLPTALCHPSRWS